MIEKFRTFLRKRGIKSRMFFAFIVLPLGVMVLMFLMYYFTSKNLIISKNRQNSLMTLELTEENIHLNTSMMEEQLTNIIINSHISNIIQEPNVRQHYEDFIAFMNDNIYLENRSNLQIYDENEKLLYSEKSDVAINFSSLMKKFTQYDDVYGWVYDKKNGQVILMRKLDAYRPTSGYVVCSFEEEAFSPSFSKVDSPHNMLIVVDKDGHYLFGSSTLEMDMKLDTSESRISIRDSRYYLESKEIENMDWKVVNLISSDYVLEEFHNFRNMILIYGIIIAIILEIIATFVYRSIYDPLLNILKTMHSVDEDNLITTRVMDEGNDEIHEVAKNFNELLDRVEELLKSVEMEQEQKRETQILLLQAQINPHFLFNTLNTLHFLAMMNDDKPVSEGINALAKLLRNTIVDSKEVVSVSEEIENLKNYIIIQKLRFGDLFETVYNVDEDVKNCHILKFLLQPIVENSILHAFEEDKQHQVLVIRIKKYRKYLMIEIGDNGKGFVQEDKEVEKTALSGIGMNNIKERIRLMYGERYSMKVRSVLGKGTIVTLLLPYVRGSGNV